MKLFFRYLKNRRKLILVFCFFTMIFLTAFVMYRLPPGAVLYPALLCLFFGTLIVILDYKTVAKKHALLTDMKKLTIDLISFLPDCQSIEEEDFKDIIANLQLEHAQLLTRMNTRYNDMVDYYTVWAHQIKTPIASMHLTLQNDDSELSRKLSGELFRIEQYVEMVLAFLRLGSDSTDYVFKEHDLDSIIKSCVKKFSSEFIGRRIRLEYTPTNIKIVTDEKWLSFVIEQLLSNALKYTENGAVKIYIKPKNILCIEDTGIGIAKEDLPRIFENGFTGYNGRSDKKATGIGLYLCKRICTNLKINISADSTPDCGTVISLTLDQKKLITE